MVEADFSGSYVNAENVHEGDIIEIAGEGENEQKESVGGRKYVQLFVPVRVNGKELIYTPSMECGRKVVSIWGKETKNWLGKKGKAYYIHYKSYGQAKKAVDIEPIIEQKK